MNSRRLSPQPISTPASLPYAGEVLPGLWVGKLMSTMHLANLAQKSTNVSPGSMDKVTVSVISILAAPAMIQLVTRALEEQRRLKNDSTNHVEDDRTPRINMEINHKVIPLRDNVDSDLTSMLPEALVAIDEALGIDDRRICLVHCAMGASRSVSVIVAYLLSRHSHTFNTFDEALRHVRTVRPQAMPNSGFEMELRKLIKK
ncbi:hypothetical protein ACHAXA_001217 [Cyclostephanos tholiformis]|uniref:Protein-tyrosine-phosphatase n=1 Tax=Cyclostephanos tholiformis TaxID=382380 RepID=A0ABD3SQ38_9STRA